MKQERRKKILCIEDNRETAALIAEELIDRGFEVGVAYSGQEGLLAIMKETPDLVLCDVSMPAMTGFEVLERLIEFAPRLGRIPFVFLTALAAREDELRGRRLGADDYVVKPIDYERLVYIVNARIDGVARTKMLPKIVTLNDREVEVLTLVARGKTSAEISRKLRLSKRTVDFHVDTARIKLRAATRTEAVVKATAGGLIKMTLILILALICTAPTLAAELPSRKAGLWEVQMAIENRNAPPQVIKQCIDTVTDQMMQSSAGPYSAAVCPKRDVQRSANSITIDSSCTIAGKTATAHAVVTGTFDSAYTMTVTSQSEALPSSDMTMTVDGRWLGPCATDQRPGDMIFENGRKVNLLDALKGMSSPNAPLLPH